MIHQPLTRGGISGQATDIMIEAEEISKTKEKTIEILAAHTGQSREKLRKDMERNFYLSAQEAKEYGIVDHILPHKK